MRHNDVSRFSHGGRGRGLSLNGLITRYVCLCVCVAAICSLIAAISYLIAAICSLIAAICSLIAAISYLIAASSSNDAAVLLFTTSFLCSVDESIAARVADAARQYAATMSVLGLDKDEGGLGGGTSGGIGGGTGGGIGYTREDLMELLRERNSGKKAKIKGKDSNREAHSTSGDAPPLSAADRRAAHIASEIRRVSDPFLVFDSDGREVEDAPETYSAECLGESVPVLLDSCCSVLLCSLALCSYLLVLLDSWCSSILGAP